MLEKGRFGDGSTLRATENYVYSSPKSGRVYYASRRNLQDVKFIETNVPTNAARALGVSLLMYNLESCDIVLLDFATGIWRKIIMELPENSGLKIDFMGCHRVDGVLFVYVKMGDVKYRGCLAPFAELLSLTGV